MKHTIKMNHKLLLLLFALLFWTHVPLVAQQKLKFTVESFEQDPFDTSARNGQYEKYDGSGARYAVIKVTSTNPDDNLKAYNFNFGNLKSSVVERDGVLWVYVQKNAKLVTISRDGYNTLHKYDLQTTIEAGKNYVMRLSPSARIIQTQMVQFNVSPVGANAIVMVKRDEAGAGEELLGSVDETGSVAKSLRYGTYTYKVVSDNYHLSEGRFTLNDKKTTHVETVVLRPDFAEITLTVASDADIYVNGDRKGRTTWTGILKAGSYTVECRQANHRSSTQFITVEENVNQTIRLDAPEPIVGTLAITSKPLSAQITIDGKDYGKTPRNVDLVIGRHNVVLSKADYREVTQSVDVKENQTEHISLELSRVALMTIDSKPSNSDLYLNGEHVGTTPYKAEMPSGDYSVRLTHDQYADLDKHVHLSISNPNVTFNLKRQYVRKNTCYIDAFGQVGMANGLGANIGGYIRNFNVEAGLLKYLGQETLYDNNSGDGPAGGDKALKTAFGIKLGYGIGLGPQLRITPQIGVNLIGRGDVNTAWSKDGKLFSFKNVGLSVGARGEYAFSPHFGLFAVPEFHCAIAADEITREMMLVSSRVKNALNGISLKVGLFVNF